MSLSNLEEKVYFAALDSGSVSFETIKTWRITDYNTLKVVVHSLVKKGYFQRIKKGYYIAKKPGEHVAQDAMILAQNLYNGYLAFSTALYVHKLSDEMPFTIFVATKYISYEKKLGNYSIKAVALGKRLVGAEKVDDYTVSTISKTIYDCFHLPQYAGGYANILKAVYNADMSKDQWKEFIYYVNNFSSYVFFQRVGYMLSILNEIKKIPDFVIKKMMKNIKYQVVLGKGKGNYIDKWKLIDCIGKKQLLSWWYNG